MYPASITSQWQMSIPAPVRRALGISKRSKVMTSVQDGKMIVEPVKDFLDLAGTFKTTKKYSQKKIDEGFADYLAKQGVAGLK